MSEYKLDFTDISLSPIVVDEKDIDSNSVDITLFGFKKLNYGEELNENFVHLLENFAVAEDPENQENPDISQTNYITPDNNSKLLEEGKQVTGQLWYNKTKLTPYVFYNNKWNKLETQGEEIAANWGQILNGEQIPQPISNSGDVFPYSECSWIVAPFNQLEELQQMVCRTDETANVTMEYIFSGETTETAAIANYLIVGIRGNNNLGSLQDPSPPPTPTPSQSMGASPTTTPTPTPSEGVTPTPTPSPSSEGLSITMNDPFTETCLALSNSQCTASKQIIIGTDYSITGGSGNFQFNWSYSSQDVFGIFSPTSSNPVLTRRLSGGLSGSGIGTLQVTDEDTGETAFEQFTFNTIHEDSGIISPPPDPTPTPSSTSEPDPTPSNTSDPDPTPSNTSDPDLTPSNTPDPSSTPTPTPEPTPSNSALEPLTATNGGDLGLVVCPNSAPAVSGSITVSGGSGDFTITAGSCVENASNLGSPPCSAVSVSASTGTASLPSVSSSLCPAAAARSLTQNFTVTDNVTGETASASVSLTQEVSATG